ncbi:bifunctional DNA primase/polymerase [Kitasatospora acidiphila]|uniref:Bifunctional DNA primase/polymerase n=1 Tax=Kitasatospora acidiphila TaxID=2567942 RepID=A0A540WFY7_9ACTN|nr:bifunctional DNA primase/polymerase [Kitasatospora acidiphila]
MASSVGVPTTSAPPLQVARWCAAQGWPVHPLAPGTKHPVANCADCAATGHRASGCRCLVTGRWCHGHLAATTDHDRLRSWWEANSQLGVGISCGPAHLVVIDVDAHAKPLPARDRLLPGIVIPDAVDLAGLATGFDTLALLAALRGHASPADDTTTLRVRTPSGGLHVWYQAHPSLPLRSSTGAGKNRALAWQVDVRARGGFIIAPGTVTADGSYTPVGAVRRPAPLPSWLAAELQRTHHAEPPQDRLEPRRPPSRARQAVIAAGGAQDGTPAVLAGLLAEVVACTAAPEGMGFSDKLNRAAFTAGGLAAAGYLSEADAAAVLLDAASTARPGQERRWAPIVRAGLAAGARRPLHLRGRA